MTLIRLIRLGLVGCVLTAAAALMVLLEPPGSTARPVSQPGPVATPTLASTAQAVLPPTATPIPTPMPTHTPTPSPIPTATPRMHVVGPEDTFYSIARAYGVPVRTLWERHPETLLVVGEPLEVPRAGPTAGAVQGPAGEINGVPLKEIIVMPPAVQTHVRDVHAYGQIFGRNPRAFAKLGDSTHMDPCRRSLTIFRAPLRGTA